MERPGCIQTPGRPLVFRAPLQVQASGERSGHRFECLRQLALGQFIPFLMTQGLEGGREQKVRVLFLSRELCPNWKEGAILIRYIENSLSPSSLSISGNCKQGSFRSGKSGLRCRSCGKFGHRLSQRGWCPARWQEGQPSHPLRLILTPGGLASCPVSVLCSQRVTLLPGLTMVS